MTVRVLISIALIAPRGPSGPIDFPSTLMSTLPALPTRTSAFSAKSTCLASSLASSFSNTSWPSETAYTQAGSVHPNFRVARAPCRRRLAAVGFTSACWLATTIGCEEFAAMLCRYDQKTEAVNASHRDRARYRHWHPPPTGSRTHAHKRDRRSFRRHAPRSHAPRLRRAVYHRASRLLSLWPNARSAVGPPLPPLGPGARPAIPAPVS